MMLCRLRYICLIVFGFSCLMIAKTLFSEDLSSITQLKKRSPNCLIKTLDVFQDGTPMTVLLLEPDVSTQKNTPIKLITYNSDGDIFNETDVIPKDESESCLVLHGPSINYYSYNSVQQICFYSNGVLCGVLKTYYPNGQLCTVVDIQNNTYEGLFEKFHEDGDLAESVNYSKGKKTGVQKCYYKNLKKLSTAHFKDDLLHGERIEWYEDGKQKLQAFYYKGLLNDTFSNCALTLYDVNGLTSKTQRYYLGQKFGSAARYSENGESYPEENQSEQVSALIVDGNYCEHYSNGQIHRRYKYAHDMFDGEQEEFYENGQPKLFAQYREKVKNGLYKEWYPDGALAVSILYENGVKNGLHVKWHPNGQKAYEAVFKQDNPVGVVQEWFENGSLLLKCFYIETSNGSKLDGEYCVWHSNGSVSEIAHFCVGTKIKEHLIYYPPQENSQINFLSRFIRYADGKLDGEQSSYYPNGSLHATMNYRNGVLHGKKALWDQEDTLVEEAFYVDGLLEGTFYIRKGDGSQTYSHYKNNRLSGLYEEYYPSINSLEKVKAMQANYVDGQLDGEVIEFNKKGLKQSVTPYSMGEKNGRMVFFSEKGIELVSIEYRRNMQNGMAYEYHPNGHVKKQVLFIDNLKENEEKAIHSNGQIASLTHYSKGLINGTTTHWNKQGVLVFEADYVQGKRHGRFNKYDEDGKPIVLAVYENDKLLKTSR